MKTDETKPRQLFVQFQQIVHEVTSLIDFDASLNITISPKKVRDYASTGKDIRGNFSDLYILQ
ncbi:hypothetical protein bAD24_III10865 [Burkholderia sp. AD24]|nr:hypothetical protein bAD24_III10865 [Burkholderia sp. AD24]